MHPIIGLVGPSGSGKTTLIKEMLTRFPEKIAPLKSFTTRPKRDEDDALFYDFIDKESMRKKNEDGDLIQFSEYAENYYGNDWKITKDILHQKAGICALVEQGVKNFRDAGFDVVVIKILPQGERTSGDATRRLADEARAQENLEADYEIVNSFAPGGLAKAVKAFEEILTNAL